MVRSYDNLVISRYNITTNIDNVVVIPLLYNLEGLDISISKSTNISNLGTN